MSTDAVLRLRGLALQRGGKPLASGLELSLGPHQAGLVLGRNGSGKSTLAWTLLGLLPPAKGSIERPARLGFAPQDPRFPEALSVRRYCHQLGALQGLSARATAAATDRALARFELEAWAEDAIGTLSRGWQQRLNLARASFAEPELLILDEAQTALDPDGLETLRLFLQHEEAPTTILLAPPGVGCEALAPVVLDLSAVKGATAA